VSRKGIVRGLLLRVQLSVGPKGVGLPGVAPVGQLKAAAGLADQRGESVL
jgi:hypothetical protein